MYSKKQFSYFWLQQLKRISNSCDQISWLCYLYYYLCNNCFQSQHEHSSECIRWPGLGLQSESHWWVSVHWLLQSGQWSHHQRCQLHSSSCWSTLGLLSPSHTHESLVSLANILGNIFLKNWAGSRNFHSSLIKLGDFLGRDNLCAQDMINCAN